MFFDIKSFLTVHFIRTDTVYDLISEIHKREGGGVGGPNFHRNVSKSHLMDIVATRYNN